MLPKPYYERDGIVIYHGDCREILPHLKADVVVTDPPYGLGGDLSFSGSFSAQRFGVQEWDKDLTARDDVIRLWGEKPYAMFCSPRRIDNLPPHRETPLIWDKGDMPAMGDCSFPWRTTYELICINGDGWSGRRDACVLRYPHNTSVASQVGHPSAKPVWLMATLISKAPPGIVLDPFMGSGTTLVAAKLEGRKAIGIEIEERYCEIAAKRLSQGVLPYA